MSSRILFDGLNFSLAKGTGIATYTKTLVAGAASLGFSTELLVSSNAGYNPRDPVFSEIALFDPMVAAHPSPKIRLQSRLARWLGCPFGVRPSNFGRLTGVARDVSGFEAFAAIHAAPNVFEMARLHFRSRKRCLDLRFDAKPEILHATFPIPIRIEGAYNIYTIHDLVPLLMPSTTLDDKKYTIDLLRELCRTADHIVTVSEHSRKDIIRVLGVPESRVSNTYQSVSISDDLLSRNEMDEGLDLEGAYGVTPGEYYLFVGAIEPKKNLRRLIDAYAASGSRRPLLVVGNLGWQYEEDLKKLQEERFLTYSYRNRRIRPERMVRHIPYLSREQLIGLLRNARALLFPSLYEGFGLPVLEAMLVGTAVLTSNAASLPEIAGEAACLVDPGDVASIARGIRALDRDNDLVSTLVARGRDRAQFFSPQAYATRLGDLYRRLGLRPAQRADEAAVLGAPAHA
jgi:glycosyltransferase involved in cell wall biosynthesis